MHLDRNSSGSDCDAAAILDVQPKGNAAMGHLPSTARIGAIARRLRFQTFRVSPRNGDVRPRANPPSRRSQDFGLSSDHAAELPLEVFICRRRLIPLSQVDQYLGPAGRIRNGTGFDFFARS
jgi:hypothetical protein